MNCRSDQRPENPVITAMYYESVVEGTIGRSRSAITRRGKFDLLAGGLTCSFEV